MDITSRGKTNCPPRILEYRAQVKIAAAILKYFSYFLLVIFLIALISFFFREHKAQGGDLLRCVTSGVTWLIIFLEYLFLLRPLAISKIQVYENKILIKRGKKEINILFDDISEIKSAVNKNLGGWFKLILKNKKKYRFTIVLERVDYIIDAVIKHNPKLMGKDEYLNLRKHLILSDHGNGRWYAMFGSKYRLITFLHAFILPTIFIVALYVKQSHQFIINSPFLYFSKLICYVAIFMSVLWIIFTMFINKIIDKHSMKNLEADVNNKVRDTIFESSVYRRFFPAYLIILALFFTGIYQTDINTLGAVSLSKTSAFFLNLKAGDSLWYDSRYNCLQCQYPVKNGDVVLTNFGIGKIVGLPNDTVSVNKRDQKGRFIASNEQKQVPQESIAIQTASQKIMIIENKSIVGKVFNDIPHFK